MPCERRGEQAMDERTSSEERETTLPRNADNPSNRISSTSTSESTNNDVAKERLAIEERLAAKMFSYEIICFFLAITFTAMAALHSTWVLDYVLKKICTNYILLILTVYPRIVSSHCDRINEMYIEH